MTATMMKWSKRKDGINSKYLAHPGARIDRHIESAQHPPAQSPELSASHVKRLAAIGENLSTPDRKSRSSPAFATLERYTRELGAALIMLEPLVERQAERL